MSSLGGDLRLKSGWFSAEPCAGACFYLFHLLLTLCLGAAGVLDAAPSETAQMKCPWFGSPASAKGLDSAVVILEFDFWELCVGGDLHAGVLCLAKDKQHISYLCGLVE